MIDLNDSILPFAGFEQEDLEEQLDQIKIRYEIVLEGVRGIR